MLELNIYWFLFGSVALYLIEMKTRNGIEIEIDNEDWFDLIWFRLVCGLNWMKWSGTFKYICMYVKSDWTNIIHRYMSAVPRLVYIYLFFVVVIFICFIPVFVFIHFIRFSSGFSVHLIDPETSNEGICDSWTIWGSMGESTGRGKLDLARLSRLYLILGI